MFLLIRPGEVLLNSMGLLSENVTRSKRLSSSCGLGVPDQEKHENVIVNVFPCFEPHTPETQKFVFVMGEVDFIRYFQGTTAFWRHCLKHKTQQVKERLDLVVQSFGWTYCWASKFISLHVKHRQCLHFCKLENAWGSKIRKAGNWRHS